MKRIILKSGKLPSWREPEIDFLTGILCSFGAPFSSLSESMRVILAIKNIWAQGLGTYEYRKAKNCPLKLYFICNDSKTSKNE